MKATKVKKLFQKSIFLGFVVLFCFALNRGIWKGEECKKNFKIDFIYKKMGKKGGQNIIACYFRLAWMRQDHGKVLYIRTWIAKVVWAVIVRVLQSATAKYPLRSVEMTFFHLAGKLIFFQGKSVSGADSSACGNWYGR